MRRFSTILGIAAITIGTLAAATFAQAPNPATHLIVDANGDRYVVAAPFTVDTLPPTTTTTTVPPTTTTTVPGLEIPPTVPYPGGLNAGDGFSWLLNCIDTPTVTCTQPNESSQLDYFGHGMPYLYPDGIVGNHDHLWWVNGDREGYRCAYAFGYEAHPKPFGDDPISGPRDGHFIVRAAVARPGGTGYGRVNDRYMEEGVRLWDGTIIPPATVGNESHQGEIPEQDCQRLVLGLTDFDYDTYQPHGPDAIRVGIFRSDGAVADIRDMTDKHTNAGHWEFISFDGNIVHLGFVSASTGQIGHGLYYVRMGDGLLSVEVNGQIVAPTAASG